MYTKIATFLSAVLVFLAATVAIAALPVLLAISAVPANAQTTISSNVSAAPQETVLYSFTYTDGAYPVAALIADRAGNLYSTTSSGGASGDGTVFKLTPGGTETVLYSFTGIPDGVYPEAGLIADRAGNLYGTTNQGGASNKGTVFKLTPSETETVLHSFAGADGALPVAALIADRAGNLYGTTYYGGASGDGTVFKLTPGGTETVLHSFTGIPDGVYPEAGLIADRADNLYGTTSFGGASGYGTVFKVTPSATKSTFIPGSGSSLTVTMPLSPTVNSALAITAPTASSSLAEIAATRA